MLAVEVDALLEHTSELAPEVEILLLVVALKLGQCVQHLLRQELADARQMPVFLQCLARNIERNVGGVHHAPHEPQEVWQDRVTPLHDHHAPGVQLQAVLGAPDKQVRRSFGRHEQHGLVLGDALGLEANVERGITPVSGDVLVELVVLLVCDLGLRPGPDRLH